MSYYPILLKRFLRSWATLGAFALLLLLGLVSIAVGRQHLDQQATKVEKAHEQQLAHIKKQVSYHPDDLPLLLYYLKFAYITPTDPLAGLSIGQSDLSTSVQHVTILGLEGQRYDTDLVNPSKLEAGNLDLSFVIIFLFPLVVIALCFSVLYEEVERGTWRLVRVQGTSLVQFFLAKMSIRLLLVSVALALLFAVAIVVLELPLNGALGAFVLLSYLYVLFWFALCYAVVSFGRSSGFNAVVLLSLWLILVVLVPVGINGYVSSRYPVGEALSLTLRQRDEYHKRWDTNKKETMDAFYALYPQLAHYGDVAETGFSWRWYYAMQHMGDAEAEGERQAMMQKIHDREALSRRLSLWLPPVRMQLSMNALAHTDLDSYMDFLEGTARFHEGLRLELYPKIFDNLPATEVDWGRYRPEWHEPSAREPLLPMALGTTLLVLLLSLVGTWRATRLR